MSQIPPTGPTPSTPPPPPPPPPGQPLNYAPPSAAAFDWYDFISFRKMLAIPTIMVLFWVGVVWAIIAGIGMMFQIGGGGGICAGLSVILIGPFVVRLYCEFIIVVFRINETLTEILNTLRGRPM